VEPEEAEDWSSQTQRESTQLQLRRPCEQREGEEVSLPVPHSKKEGPFRGIGREGGKTCENGSYGNKSKLYKTEDLHTANTNIENLNMGKYRQDYTHYKKRVMHAWGL
jgi:hypothetical protein